MNEDEIAKRVLDAAYEVHTVLGPGLLESVYEVVLADELRNSGMSVQRQVPIQIKYKEMIFKEGYRADLVVAEKILIELKCVETLKPVHAKQVLTYLRLADLRLGLLLNFGEASLKNGIKRLVNGLPE